MMRVVVQNVIALSVAVMLTQSDGGLELIPDLWTTRCRAEHLPSDIFDGEMTWSKSA